MSDIDFEYAFDQAKTEETLGDIDISYIIDCIYNQLNNLYSTSQKIDYLSVLESAMKKLPKEYSEDSLKSVYPAIIDKIAEHFEFDVDTTEYPIEKVAHTFYKFFVCNYVENITMFIEMVIIEKQKEIVAELKNREGINESFIPDIPTGIGLILNNLREVVDIISGEDISFTDFLSYIRSHDDSKSSVEKMINYEEKIMDKTDSIVPSILNFLSSEEEGFGTIFISIQSYIYNRFCNE